MTVCYTDYLLVARAELRQAKAVLSSEIRGYPTPISGCDAQFNHLIGERSRISAALLELERDVFVPTPRTPYEGAGIESR